MRSLLSSRARSDVQDRQRCATGRHGNEKGRPKITNNVDSAALESILAADLHRAKAVAEVREKKLPTPALTKAELAELLFENVGLNKREAQDMIEAFFEEIRNALERGETVKMPGFGTFRLRDKSQRPGRNPRTNEKIAVKARRVVTFHASEKLKETVEQTKPLGRAT